MRDAASPSVRPPRRAARSDRRSRLARGSGVRLCLSSAPPRAAARLARLLLAHRLAACVSVVPGVRSTYRWKGRVEQGKEVLLVVKTTAALVPRCVALLASEHPYEVPEILVAAPDRVSAAYAAWVHAETA